MAHTKFLGSADLLGHKGGRFFAWPQLGEGKKNKKELSRKKAQKIVSLGFSKDLGGTKRKKPGFFVSVSRPVGGVDPGIRTTAG